VTKSKRSLGELELEVLKVIWKQQPCTVQEVAEIMHERRGLARTTVLTVMQRLHRKRFLRRRKRQGLHRYSTAEERSSVISGLIDQFVDRVLDGSTAPFIAYLAETGGLTREQSRALREIARSLERESGEETR